MNKENPIKYNLQLTILEGVKNYIKLRDISLLKKIGIADNIFILNISLKLYSNHIFVLEMYQKKCN
jgi:hypothetical protein